MSKKRKLYHLQYLFIALILTVTAIGIGWYVHRSVVITEISVAGDVMTGADKIIAKSELSEGLQRDSVVFLEVIERVETLPWVSSAFATMSPSGEVRIRVEEEEPMALLVDEGRSALVTESGIRLPVILGKAVDVPILYGHEVSERPDTLRSKSFETARSFLILAREYPALYAMISEVMVTETEGVVVLTDENAVRLTFGHEQFDDRIRNWQAFQSQVISEKGIRNLRSIDFRFRGQVVTREQ